MLVCVAAVAGGCSATPDYRLMDNLRRGDLGAARVSLQQRVRADQSPKSDRDYMLDRMRLAIVAMSDGYPAVARGAIDEMFDVLTTQGLNVGREFSAVVFHEGVRIWKGEPFEQALALHYIATHYAMMGSWDNARAAILNSLAHLRDGEAAGDAIDVHLLAARARAIERGQDPDAVVGKSFGYVTTRSDFTLGYLMTALANQQVAAQTGDRARLDEASDNYREVLRLAPQLQPLVSDLQAGRYNTLFVIDYGQGPRKVAAGPDGAIAVFDPQFASDARRIAVDDGSGARRYAHVCDINAMATNHLWRGLEDARLAKSAVGTGMMLGGAIAASTDDRDAQLAGLGLILAGMAAKATAAADTRYCEALPQRVYIVPAMVKDASTRVMLQVDADAGSRIVLAGMSPPSGGAAAVHYVRLLSGSSPPRWAITGEVAYATSAVRGISWDGPAMNTPYILGGQCVRTPDYELVEQYRAKGLLTSVTLSQLQTYYREEGIAITADNHRPLRHVLEGGDSLLPPVPGSTGFARIFGELRPRYQPRSETVRRASVTIEQHPRRTTSSGGAATEPRSNL